LSFQASDAHLERQHPLWQSDRVELSSVGIDIGSATLSVMFSVIELVRLGRELTSRYVVLSRRVLYRSPLQFTPYRTDGWIDEQAVRLVVTDAYEAAGLSPGDVDTGAVILTGEAMRRRNARALGEELAQIGGDFVCVAAGHHMEALLAAHGSGAVAASRDEKSRVLNIDVGGGTTKFALVDSGVVVRTAALHVGGRLAAFDERSRISRLEPMGRQLAADCGFAWDLGATVTRDDVAVVGRHIANLICSAVGWTADGDDGSSCRPMWLTEPIGELRAIDKVVMSGGVSEYVYRPERVAYEGDLGREVGLSVAELSHSWPSPLAPSQSGIDATVIGASQYTVQLSGNTIYVSDEDTLPIQNLPVVHPAVDLTGDVDSKAVAEAIAGALEFADSNNLKCDVALAFHWEGEPSYQRVLGLARGIADGTRSAVPPEARVCVVLESDIAQLLGALLDEQLHRTRPVLVVDGVSLDDFDFIDIGKIRAASQTVPVTIKSLAFGIAFPD
jgi:ethanolamine utilization protein EutA